MKIYVAGPLFNIHERWYLEQMTAALEIAGFDTFLPHRDAGLVGDITDPAVRKRIFQTDVDALEECDMIVALLTGADHDSGTCGELGYMYAKGKPCFGLKDDPRYLNNLIWGLCGEGRYLANTLDELLVMVTEHGKSE